MTRPLSFRRSIRRLVEVISMMTMEQPDGNRKVARDDTSKDFLGGRPPWRVPA